jgi:DNA-binding MurR/RpiR family transcriptional regulator
MTESCEDEVAFLRATVAMLQRKLAAKETKEFFTLAEIAAKTGMSVWTVRRLISKVGVRYFKLARKIYVPASELSSRLSAYMTPVEEPIVSDLAPDPDFGYLSINASENVDDDS